MKTHLLSATATERERERVHTTPDYIPRHRPTRN